MQGREREIATLSVRRPQPHTTNLERGRSLERGHDLEISLVLGWGYLINCVTERSNVKGNL